MLVPSELNDRSVRFGFAEIELDFLLASSYRLCRFLHQLAHLLRKLRFPLGTNDEISRAFSPAKPFWLYRRIELSACRFHLPPLVDDPRYVRIPLHHR